MRFVAITCLLLFASCRTMARRRPPAEPGTPPAGQPAVLETPAASRAESDTVSTAVAAIIDSIETAVRDSIDGARRDSLAATAARDSAIAAARRDSIAAAARRDSIAAAAHQDSLAAAARRDSILAAARQDSIATARRDSLAVAARRDSAAAVAARRDSLAAVARRDSLAAAEAEARSATGPEVLETLRALGPSYIPYDEGPIILWDTERQARLTTTLLPVVRAEGLTARTQTYFWILVTAEGAVDRVVLQTSSGNDAFDEAAEQAALQLHFRPGTRGQRPVPTWVVRGISLIMQ